MAEDKKLNDIVELEAKHLRHFNYLLRERGHKPAAWLVKRAIKNFEIFNCEREFGVTERDKR